MIPSLIIGRKGSVGFPGKNKKIINNKPLFYYTCYNAIKANVGPIYMSTDDEEIKDFCQNVINIKVINRPKELCTTEALGEDVFVHGYKYIRNELNSLNINFDKMILLFCNAVTYHYNHILEGIDLLKECNEYDSAVTVSKYNYYSPARARVIKPDGKLHPYIPKDIYDLLFSKEANCDRNSTNDCWFADCCVSVVKTRNLENLSNGMLPQKWMGNNILPIFNKAGLDIDEEFQLPLVEYWINKYHPYTIEEAKKI